MILRSWVTGDLLVTHNLSEGKTNELRPYLRASVRRASGFVLTGYSEVSRVWFLSRRLPGQESCASGTSENNLRLRGVSS
jgi:hypothetical protein